MKERGRRDKGEQYMYNRERERREKEKGREIRGTRTDKFRVIERREKSECL